jgi:hypothetical protein
MAVAAAFLLLLRLWLLLIPSAAIAVFSLFVDLWGSLTRDSGALLPDRSIDRSSAFSHARILCLYIYM